MSNSLLYSLFGDWVVVLNQSDSEERDLMVGGSISSEYVNDVTRNTMLHTSDILAFHLLEPRKKSTNCIHTKSS